MLSLCLSEEEKTFLHYYVDQDGHNVAILKSDKPHIWYLDCEMVETVDGLNIVSVGIGNDDIQYLFKVKPMSEVTNWLTKITGMDNETTFDFTYEQLIDKLKTIINIDDILIGHHLYNDLQLLNWYQTNICDTCMIFHHPDSPPNYYSLKELAKMFLKRDIQITTHDPLEDGKTCYDLLKLYVEKKYIKTCWKNIGLYFVPSHDLIMTGLDIKPEQIECIYTRGSRAVGTNRDDSDYDIIVVCSNDTNYLDGTLVRYGNIDLCVYSTSCFEQFIKKQIIWAIECIYCPSSMCYMEKIDFRKMFEDYRISHCLEANQDLRQSIGYETSRKISSSKKQYMLQNYNQSKKHSFIALRFVDYGLQIIKYNKLIELQRMNYMWEIIKNNPNDVSHHDFENQWFPIYKTLNKEFCQLVPKKITHNTKDIIMLILQSIQDGVDEEFCNSDAYSGSYCTIKKEYDDFMNQVNDMFTDLIKYNVSRKDFALLTQKYNRKFHKYLFILYEKKDVKLVKVSKLYKDIVCKQPIKRKLCKYEPIPRDMWEKYQIENAKKVIKHDVFDKTTIRFVGGLDISFDKMCEDKGCAYLTVYDLIDKKIIHECHKICTLTVPYVSGFLGFREIPAYNELLDDLKLSSPQFFPELLMVDGFGILHHRDFGSASHIGYEMDLPCIGIAKTLLFVDGLTNTEIKEEYKKKCKNAGDYIELIGTSGKKYGVALKNTPSTENPVFVSIGHQISIETAIEIVMRTSIYRIPEPIRNSDIKSKLFL